MRPPEDKELDQQLRDAVRRHADDLVFSRPLQDRVLATIETRKRADEGVRRHPLAKRFTRRSRAFTVGLSSAAACLLLAAWGVASWQQSESAHRGAGTQFASVNATTNSEAIHSASGVANDFMQLVTTTIPASLAPVESEDLALTPGITSLAEQQQSQRTASTGTGATSTGQTVGSGASSYVQLSRQAFTVSTRLYNTSNQPLPGNSLQGMLFILKQPAGLSPAVEADWEYFVDGPSAVIPPHQSVPWTFTPNPAPPYRTLSDRQAHLIWMFRSPHAHYPTLYLGTLPVRVSQVKLEVTGTTHTAVKTEFLRVAVRLTNQGASDFDVRSALGMLFFTQRPGASLLSRGTYKYFDDLTPVGHSPYVLHPGQSSEVQFVITGVPGAQMQSLPLTVLLVARNQIGA
ncbi:MAG: hypothetical protein OWT28_08440 [Firmicutes bacterium]|nr:hypothetical protein [Bacillota bacterium]